MRVFYSIAAILFLSLLVPVFAFGQASLKGTIMDAATNETLIGVNIVVQGTSLGAATNIEGQFRIVGIPEQPFTVKVSYVGYEPKLIEIDFSKTKDANLNLQLTPTIIEGKEVVVTGQMRGQLQAINQQINSNTIVNVVSEEKIKELPDANAAEAIGRLPGVSIKRSGGEASQAVLRGLSSKFSNITVDGVKIPATDPNTRDVDLSMMSQGMLAGIELYKALTPDQDADAIAGTINFVTRKAPSERLIRFDLMGNYNNLMGSAKQYDFQARYGERFFDDVLGLQLQANLEDKIRSKENSSYSWSGHKSTSWESKYKLDPYATNYNDYTDLGSYVATFTDENRARKGIQAIIDINTPDSGSVKLTGTYSGTDRDISTHDRTYVGTSSSAYWDYNYDYKELRMNTTNVSLQGQNYFSGLEFNWLASYAKSVTKNPFDFALKFTGGSGIGPLSNTGEGLVARADNNYSAAACSTGVFQTQNNFDQEKTIYLNIAKKYTIGNSISGELKAGGKYKEKNRYMNLREQDDNNYLNGYTAYPDGINTGLLLSSRFASYYNSSIAAPLTLFIDTPPGSRKFLGSYTFKPLLNMDALRLWYDLFKSANNGGNREFRESEAGRINDYNVTERVTSAYIMNTFNFTQLATLMIGVRVEKESNDYIAKYNTGSLGTMGIVVTTSRSSLDSTANFDQTIWLPNIQFILRPAEYLKLRFVAHKAIGRPDYNLRLPQFYAQSQPGNKFIVTGGSNNLKNMEAWNFEANAQVFNGSIGLISVSAFFKRIDNFIHVTNDLAIDKRFYDSLVQVYNLRSTNPEVNNLIYGYNSMEVNLPYNDNKPTFVWGLEFEHQMNFGFLPGFLKNMVLTYNLSLTRSETHILYGQTVTSWRMDSTRHGFPGNYYYSHDTVLSSTNKFKQVMRESEGQPKLYGNAALGYDIDGFSARLSLFYQGRSVKSYHYQDQANNYVEAFTKLDLSLKQQISKTISVFLNINNLLDKSERITSENDMTLYEISSWRNPSKEELYGRTIDLGLRISL
jgi:TonB-dependent receptor